MNLWQIAFTGHAHPKCAQCKTAHPGAVCVLFVSNLNSPGQRHLPPVVAPIPATAKKSAATSMEVAILRRRAASPTPAVSVARTTHARGVVGVLEVVRPKVGAAEGRVGGGSGGPPAGQF